MRDNKKRRNRINLTLIQKPKVTWHNIHLSSYTFIKNYTICLKIQNDIGKRKEVIERQITSIIYEVKQKYEKGQLEIKLEERWKKQVR